jgi:hypothetical protein
VPLVGDSKAYAFLKKHGALIHELPNKALMLTLDGRVFIVTFLLFQGYLTKELFNEIAERKEVAPQFAAYDTGKLLRTACQRWLKETSNILRRSPDAYVYPTDLTYAQLSLLLNLLVAYQENLEGAAEGRKVQ